jgi:hypothetical protein
LAPISDHFVNLHKNPALNTQTKRMGAAVRAGDTGVRIWRRNTADQILTWT